MEDIFCSDCKRNTAVVFDHSAGDTICSECGLVLEAHSIDETSEWRTFANETADNDPHRVGEKSNHLLTNSGLTTMISMPTGGANRSSTGRFRNINTPDPDRGLIEAFKVIAVMSDRLGLVSTIKDLANEIYKKMDDAKATRGRNKEALMAACLYTACNKLEKSRTMKEIHSVASGNVTRKEIGRAKLEISKHLEYSIDEKPTDPAEFVRRFCSNLGLSIKAVKAAEEAVKNTAECDIRRIPITVAASIVYMITQLSDEKTQIREVALATGVAQATIKNSYKDIYPHAAKLVPAWYANEEDLKKLSSP
ncbi:hypothetical protein C5167_025236 [Papaver somniferum]|uniref:TFIIB-type domain-containing protein n=1 Tax=Papaver somniferum TaxID=3469 RepID=A0A4Y7JTU2_PAPSO|nr:transcription initiation factor IIB-2-like [Papaver somniferum]RZC63462.1 hypothetical protein C5167_025236 [Papaver somniferum]